MWRGTLTLILGSGAAQLGPLLLGPFLTRLYGPEVFGVFHLASAIAGNLAVVACARYEFALPLARSEAEAQALRALCIRVLTVVGLATTLGAAACAWWWQIAWPLGVPALVVVLGALSLWTLEATRRERFGALARARITQFWGCGLLQWALGTVHAGLWSLLLGPVLAAVAAAWGLWRDGKGSTASAALEAPIPSATPIDWKAAANRHRDFPLLNTPHAFLGALQDTVSMALIAAWAGPAAAGVWGLALRYLKAPATLAGGAVSQVLYPALGAQAGASVAARTQVRQIMRTLMVCGVLLGAAVYTTAQWALPALLGPGWEAAGPLGQALAVYIALHFVASPLGVVTMAWNAQAWALRMAVVGQLVFVLALAAGLLWSAGQGDGQANGQGNGQAQGLTQAAWLVSAAMAAYFTAYFWRLWHWPLAPVDGPTTPAAPTARETIEP